MISAGWSARGRKEDQIIIASPVRPGEARAAPGSGGVGGKGEKEMQIAVGRAKEKYADVGAWEK